jgi:hypothetical protein
MCVVNRRFVPGRASTLSVLVAGVLWMTWVSICRVMGATLLAEALADVRFSGNGVASIVWWDREQSLGREPLS